MARNKSHTVRSSSLWKAISQHLEPSLATHRKSRKRQERDDDCELPFSNWTLRFDGRLEAFVDALQSLWLQMTRKQEADSTESHRTQLQVGGTRGVHSAPEPGLEVETVESPATSLRETNLDRLKWWLKFAIVRLAADGLLPASFATWMINRAGLRNV